MVSTSEDFNFNFRKFGKTSIPGLYGEFDVDEILDFYEIYRSKRMQIACVLTVMNGHTSLKLYKKEIRKNNQVKVALNNYKIHYFSDYKLQKIAEYVKTVRKNYKIKNKIIPHGSECDLIQDLIWPGYLLLDSWVIKKTNRIIEALVVIQTSKGIIIKLYRWKNNNKGKWKVALANFSIDHWEIDEIINKIIEFKKKYNL